MVIAGAAEKALEQTILLAVERAETTPSVPAARNWK
jgi:hypothetical protein